MEEARHFIWESAPNSCCIVAIDIVNAKKRNNSRHTPQDFNPTADIVQKPLHKLHPPGHNNAEVVPFKVYLVKWYYFIKREIGGRI